MKALTLAALCLCLLACDDKKSAPPAPSAAPSAVPTAALSSVAAVPSAKPEKKQVDCPKGNDVTFTDKGLEDEVRRKLGKDGGTLTKSDLAQVKSVNLTRGPVNELDPCVFPLLTGMKDLFLGQGDLSDLSPLTSLTNLATLRASINQVSDIHPLEKMTKMDRLDIGRTQVSDISPIANMTGITELQLDDTPVADITPLRACTKLEKLSLKRTLVKDLTPLKDMKKLRFLYIEGAPIESTQMLDPLVGDGLKVVRSGTR
jgi:internalin A